MPNNLVMRIPNNKIRFTTLKKEQSEDIQQKSQNENVILSTKSSESVKFSMSLNIASNSLINNASNSKGCGCK